MTFTESIDNFKRCVAGNETPYQGVYECESERAFEFAAKVLLEVQTSGRKAGYDISYKGTDKGGVRTAWIAFNGYELRIRYKYATRAQDVTATSREAYAALPKGESRRVWREAAIKVQEQHGSFTDHLVSALTGVPESRVSARRNEHSDLIEQVGYLTGPYGKRHNAYRFKSNQKQDGAQVALFQ